MSTINISEKCPVSIGYFVLVSVLAKMRACTSSYGPSLHRKINAVGIKKSDPISVLHVAVSVIARMCTCTVSYAPSLLGIEFNTVRSLAEIRAWKFAARNNVWWKVINSLCLMQCSCENRCLCSFVWVACIHTISVNKINQHFNKPI